MEHALAPAGESPSRMRMVMTFEGAASETHLVAALASLARSAAGLVLVATCALPASAQFWESRPSRPSVSYFQQMFGPFQSYPQGPPEYREGSRPQVDYSRAPAPKKSETTPLSTIVVMGDSMADWLA